MFDDMHEFCLSDITAECHCVLVNAGSYQYQLFCDPHNRVETIPAIRTCKDRCVCGQTVENQRLDVPGSDRQHAQARQGGSSPVPLIHT